MTAIALWFTASKYSRITETIFLYKVFNQCQLKQTLPSFFKAESLFYRLNIPFEEYPTAEDGVLVLAGGHPGLLGVHGELRDERVRGGRELRRPRPRLQVVGGPAQLSLLTYTNN